MSQRAAIFLNGIYSGKDFDIFNAMPGDMIIGVDGGSQYLSSIGLQPQIIIGDLDSLPVDQLHRFEAQGTKFLRYPREKDDTDFELALSYAIGQNCDSIFVFGALGGRVDHILANLFLPIQFIGKASIRFVHGHEELIYISGTTIVKGRKGDLLSLIPIAGTVTGVKTIGVKYPLRGEDLLFGKTRGVSNEMVSTEAKISITSGILLGVHSRPTTIDDMERCENE